MIDINADLIKQLAFYGFSALSLFAAIMVVSSKHSVRAVLFLVLTFVSMAANWILLESEFLGIALILVYVGAVMVLFLFVVMMLDFEGINIKTGFTRYVPVGLLVGGVVTGALLTVVNMHRFSPAAMPAPAERAADYSNVQALGETLFTEYLLPFELAGVMLLVAIIAAIALTFRGASNSKKQSPDKQVRVRKADRLKIVSVKSEGQ